jgi:hypothetical protein
MRRTGSHAFTTAQAFIKQIVLDHTWRSNELIVRALMYRITTEQRHAPDCQRRRREKLPPRGIIWLA